MHEHAFHRDVALFLTWPSIFQLKIRCNEAVKAVRLCGTWRVSFETCVAIECVHACMRCRVH